MLETGVQVVVAQTEFVGQRLREDVALAEHEVLAQVSLRSIVAKPAAIQDGTQWRSPISRLMPVAEAGVGIVFRSDIPVRARIPLEGIVAGRPGDNVVVDQFPAVSIGSRVKIEQLQSNRTDGQPAGGEIVPGDRRGRRSRSLLVE